MKKFILLTILLSSLVLSSCEKDSVTNLAGTTWKSLDVDDPAAQEYMLLKFQDTTFELWFKVFDNPLSKDSQGVYVIMDNVITLTSKYYNIETDLTKNKIVFSMDAKLRTFTKQ